MKRALPPRTAWKLRAPESRAKPETRAGEGFEEGARWAPSQNIFAKSILKWCNLVHTLQVYIEITITHLQLQQDSQCTSPTKKTSNVIQRQLSNRLSLSYTVSIIFVIHKKFRNFDYKYFENMRCFQFSLTSRCVGHRFQFHRKTNPCLWSRDRKRSFASFQPCWRNDKVTVWGWSTVASRINAGDWLKKLSNVSRGQWRSLEVEMGGGKNWRRNPNRVREAPDNWGRSSNRRRSPRFSKGRGLGREGARWAFPQKILETSYLKPCNLVYSWSENLFLNSRWRIHEFAKTGRGSDGAVA